MRAVRVVEGAKLGTYVRRAGLDFSEGEVLLYAGRRLPPRDIAPWLVKDVAVSLIPVIMAPDVHISPGRTPRSDYSRPKPVHVQIMGGPHKKVVATLVSLTFH